MDHPRFVRSIHSFFNPVRHGALKELDQQRPPMSPLRKPLPRDEFSTSEARRQEILNPNNVSYAQVYVMLALTVAAVAVVLAFVIFR